MKESRTGADRNEIFREPWDSEDGLRSRNSLPYNITFLNGVGIFNGSTGYVTNAIPLKGVYSIRFRLTALSPSATQYLLDCRANSGTGYIRIDSATAVSASSGTIYVDGVATSTISANSKEIVVSGITISSTLSYLGRINSSAANFLNASVEIFQIYNISLTANQIKNLYNNSAYKPFIPHGEILGSELIVNGGFVTDTNWNKGIGWTIDTVNGRANFSGNSDIVIYQAIAGYANKIIRITYTIVSISSGGFAARLISDKNGTIRSIPGTYTETLYAGATISGFGIISTGATVGVIDNISVKEVLSTANLILDVNAFKGTIRNRLSGSVLNGVAVPNIVNTNVVAVKDSCGWSMLFNGSTSKLSIGSYVGLTGDISGSFWIKPINYGGSDQGGLIDNGKFRISIRGSSIKSFYLYSEYVTIAKSATSSINIGNYQQLIITRNSSGLTNFYINGILSGTANQSSGTPVSGSTIYIGNDLNSSFPFNGKIASIRIYQGILSQESISQIFSSEKSKYNL